MNAGERRGTLSLMAPGRHALLLLSLSLVSRAEAAPGAPSPSPLVLPTAIENEAALAPFLAKLAALKAKRIRRVRITHYGDSHVTSDVMTGELRARLQAEYGDGGPGFVLVGKPWPTYTHALVKTGADAGAWRAERVWAKYGAGRPKPRDDLFGLAGVSVSSRQNASTWLELRRRAPLASLDLYALRQPGGGRLDLVVGGQRARWLFTVGSEKEAAFADVSLPPGTTRVELHASLGEVRLFGADLSSGRPGVVYDVLGLNGARAATLLAYAEPLWSEQLRRLGPDLVVLAFGANEVDNEQLTREAFARGFDELLLRLRRMLPTAACLVIAPPDRGRYRRKTGWEIPENQGFILEEERRLARARGCAFWDQRAAMGGAGGILRFLAASPPLAQSDRVHLTGRGYRLLAEALHAALVAASTRAALR